MFHHYIPETITAYNIPIYTGGFWYTSPSAGGGQSPEAGQISTPSHGNSSQWNTAYGWGNHASAGYLTAGSVDAATLDGQNSAFYRNASNINAGTFPDRFSNSTRYNIGYIDGVGVNSYDKLRVWDSSSYTIGMHSGQTHGWLNDYAMTFTMNNETDRGFKWRDTSDAPDAAVADDKWKSMRTKCHWNWTDRALPTGCQW